MSKLFYRVRDLAHRVTDGALVPIKDCYADFESLEAAQRWLAFVETQPNVASARDNRNLQVGITFNMEGTPSHIIGYL